MRYDMTDPRRLAPNRAKEIAKEEAYKLLDLTNPWRLAPKASNPSKKAESAADLSKGTDDVAAGDNDNASYEEAAGTSDGERSVAATDIYECDDDEAGDESSEEEAPYEPWWAPLTGHDACVQEVMRCDDGGRALADVVQCIEARTYRRCLEEHRRRLMELAKADPNRHALDRLQRPQRSTASSISSYAEDILDGSTTALSSSSSSSASSSSSSAGLAFLGVAYGEAPPMLTSRNWDPYNENEVRPPDDPEGLLTLTVSISCFEGRLRSVALAELVATHFKRAQEKHLRQRLAEEKKNGQRRKGKKAAVHGLASSRFDEDDDEDDEDDDEEDELTGYEVDAPSLAVRQRQHPVRKGAVVRVLFDKKHWYRGVVNRVLVGKIRIKYEDGTSETTSFPDNDVVIMSAEDDAEDEDEDEDESAGHDEEESKQATDNATSVEEDEFAESYRMPIEVLNVVVKHLEVMDDSTDFDESSTSFAQSESSLISRGKGSSSSSGGGVSNAQNLWMSWGDAWGMLRRHGWQRYMGQGIDTNTYYCPPGVERVRGVPVGVEGTDYFVGTDAAILYAQRNIDSLSRPVEG